MFCDRHIEESRKTLLLMNLYDSATHFSNKNVQTFHLGFHRKASTNKKRNTLKNQKLCTLFQNPFRQIDNAMKVLLVSENLDF